MKTSFTTQLFLWLLSLFASQIAVAQSSYSTDTAYVSTLIHRGEAVENQDLKKAIGLYRNAYTAAKRLDFQKGYFQAIRVLVFALNNVGQHTEAKQIAEEALQRSEPDTSRYHKSLAHNALAVTAMATGDWRESIRQFEQAAALSHQLGRSDNEASIYNNIGVISQRQKLYTQAMAFHQKALAIRRRLPNNARDAASSLFNIGVVYGVQGKPQLEKDYTQRAIALLDPARDQDMLITMYNNLGDHYRGNEQYDSCQYYLTKALTLARQTKNPNQEFHLLTTIAYAYHSQKKTSDARRYLSLARRMLDTLKLGLPEQQALLAQEVNNAELRGDFKAAYTALSTYVDNRDSLVNKDVQEQVAVYDERMRQAEARERIARLEASRAQQTRWLWIVGLTALMLAVGVVLGWLYYRQRQRTAAAALLATQQEQELLAVRAELTGQQKERQRISKEMHDDLGASMTAIGLLSEVAKTRVDAEAVPEVGKISEISATMVTAMNEIIWSLNTRNDSLNGLVAYIRAYAREFIDNTPLRLRIDSSESADEVPIRGSDRRNVFLTVKEALNNVVKHAQATEVTLQIHPRMTPEGSQLHIDVCDNGRGFDPDELAHGLRNGLTNMQARMQESGGSCTIRPTSSGTCVEIRFPF